MAEPNTNMPIETDMHTPTVKASINVLVAEVAEVTDALELMLSIICYCGLPVAQYKIHKQTSQWYGEWFIWCP